MVIVILEVVAIGGGVLSLLPGMAQGARLRFSGMSLLAGFLLCLNLLGVLHL